jgi:hypothetical protein
MAYEPPPWTVVDINFTGVYTPPTWSSVNIEFQDGPSATRVYPVGFDSLDFSPVKIGFPSSFVRPYGFASLEYGGHNVDFFIRTLFAFGRNQTEFGADLSVTNFHQTAQPLGFSDEALGEPSLLVLRQYIGVQEGPDMSVFGNSTDPRDQMLVRSSIGPTQVVAPLGLAPPGLGPVFIDFALRYIRFLDQPFDATQWGEASVIFKIRRIEVPWSVFTQWGLPEFGRTALIKPFGPDGSGVGTPNVVLGSLRQMNGFSTLVMGAPSVRGSRRYVQVAPWGERDKVGTAYVFNSTQILYVDNKQFFDYAPYFSAFNAVANRNRVLHPVGFTTLKTTILHRLILTGQQVLPTLGEQTQWGDAMVAFRIREVKPTWRFAGFVDPYHYVHNYATRLYPVGLDSAQFGRARTWFNRQTIAPRFIKQDAYGRPFVADRVRWVQQYNSVGPFPLGTAWVSNRIRTLIEPPWPVEYEFGLPSLKTHRNIVKPFPIAYNEYGTPRLHNVTPQIYPGTPTQTGYGTPWVSYLNRPLAPQGIRSLAIDPPIVTFRDRTVLVPSIAQSAVPRPTVRQEVEEIRGDQTIFPYGYDGNEYPGQIGLPSLHPQPHPVGFDSAEFGSATSVRLQGCSPYWSYPDSFFGFGFPSLNATQKIVQINKKDELGAQTGWTIQRLDPHTIWARLDTPLQAQENHPESKLWTVMDTGPLGMDPPPPWFGPETRVWGPGTIYVFHYHYAEGDGDGTVGGAYGQPLVQNKRRVIRPIGWDSRRFGFPTLPGTTRLWVRPFEMWELGVPAVSHPPLTTQWIGPVGFETTEWVAQHVENWIREVFPPGMDETVFGNNDPMVYHYPRGMTEAGGSDSAEFGDETFISYRNRECLVDGIDSFEEGFTFGQFDERLFVTRNAPPRNYSVGDALRMGTPKVAAGGGSAQKIAPYMIPPPQYCHPHSITET